MHAYLITAKPTRWQLFGRAVRVGVARLLLAILLITLGSVTLLLRIHRVIANLLATFAARTELEVSLRTGLPPLGAVAGARIAAAFAEEFRTAWTMPTEDSNRSERTDT